ncbi:hypothetical protein BGX23_002085 [Mortierella sp. AD031]|nr:hypothetical protein BGX23_002085 [Mortierella sp. AD031]
MRPREKRCKTAPSTSTINTTSSTSTSRVSTPARAAPSTPIPATIPGAEGMTAVQNSDETIMFFNPATGTTTYRCGLCPPRGHELKRHQESKHRPQDEEGRQETGLRCDFCLVKCARRDALLRHYSTKAKKDHGIHPRAD